MFIDCCKDRTWKITSANKLFISLYQMAIIGIYVRMVLDSHTGMKEWGELNIIKAYFDLLIFQ